MKPRRDARRYPSGYVFTWWEDALAFANRAAARTGRRRRVHRAQPGRHLWVVSEVDL